MSLDNEARISFAPNPLPWLCLAIVIVSALASTASPLRLWTMLVVFGCSVVSTVAGFAFSALAGAILFHLYADPVYVLGILLVSSLSAIVCAVWSARRTIDWFELAPYVAGGALTVFPGLFLLLNTKPDYYLLVLGCFLIAYGSYAMIGPALVIRSDSRAARFLVGSVGGITGALAAFPAAFVVIWCCAQGMDKHRQLAIVRPFILLMQIITLGALTIVQPARSVPPIELTQFIAPAILGAYVGLAACDALTTNQVNRIINVVLLASGLILTARAI